MRRLRWRLHRRLRQLRASFSWPQDYAASIGRVPWRIVGPPTEKERAGQLIAAAFDVPLSLLGLGWWVSPSGQVWERWPAFRLTELPEFTAERGGIRFVSPPGG